MASCSAFQCTSMVSGFNSTKVIFVSRQIWLADAEAVIQVKHSSWNGADKRKTSDIGRWFQSESQQ